MTEWVTLNVGGTIFETTKATLVKSKYLTEMANDKYIERHKGIIKIDRSGKLFEHVLCYLRDPEYPYNILYKSELDYYKIEYDEDKLYRDFFYIKKDSIESLNMITKDQAILNMMSKLELNKCGVPACANPCSKHGQTHVCKDHQNYRDNVKQ